jgi:hypothetical protein
MPANDRHDKALEASFPASDPPATPGITGPVGERKDRNTVERQPQSETGDDDAKPKGSPTSDRHAAETAYQSEQEEQHD